MDQLSRVFWNATVKVNLLSIERWWIFDLLIPFVLAVHLTALCDNYTLCDNGKQPSVLTEHWESCYLQCRTDYWSLWGRLGRYSRLHLISSDFWHLLNDKNHSEASPFSSAANTGKVLWNGNWVTFLDTLLHVIIVAETGRSLRLPTRIRSVFIDPVLHQEQVCQYQDNVEGNVSHAWAFASCFDCSVDECMTS